MIKAILFFLVIIYSVYSSNEDYITAFTSNDWSNNISLFDDDLLACTDGGFVKYDLLADTFRIYHKFNSPMPFHGIREVVKDRENSYWMIPNISSPAYLYKFKNDEWSIYTEKNFAPLVGGHFVDHIAIDRDGKIWILIYPYLRRISGDTYDKSYYLPELGFKTEIVFSMEIDRDNSIWLSTRLPDDSHDVVKIAADTVSFRLSLSGMLKGRRFPILAIDSLNNVWIATDSGVTKYDGKNFWDYNENNSIIRGREHFDISAGKKFIWMIGPDSTIYKFDIDKDEWMTLHYKKQKYHSAKDITAYKDKAIFMNQSLGLEQADTTVRFLKRLSPMPGQFQYANLIIDRNGRIMGLRSRYFSDINPDSSLNELNLYKFGIDSDQSSFCIDSSDILWVVDDNSLIRLNKDLKPDSSIKAPQAKSKFFKIVAIDDKKVCLLSEKQLFIFNGSNWQEEDLPESEFPNNELRDICIDYDKNIVILGNHGIFTKKLGKWKYFGLAKQLPKPFTDLSLKKILSDNKGGYYIISTLDLFHLIDSTFGKINLRICSNRQLLDDICIDHNGKLWIIGESGLSSYDGFEEKIVFNYDIHAISSCIDYKNNLWIGTYDELIKIKPHDQLPDNFIKTVKMNALVYNPESGKFDREIESTDIYDLMPSKANYDMLYPVGYFKNDTKDRYLNFKVRAYAFDKNKPLSYYEVDKNIDSVSLSGDPNITMLDSVGNSVPFSKEHGLPPGITARVVFPSFKPSGINGALDGDIVMKLASMNYDLDNNKPFPLEDVTDDTVSKKIALIGIADEIQFKNSFDTLIKEGNYHELIINPKVWVNTGGTVYMENRLSDFGTNHIKVNYNDDKSITLENVPYPLIKLNRFSDNYGNDYPGKSGGGSIVSPIINCVNRYNSYLNIELSRNIILDDNSTSRVFSASGLIGPERRVTSPDNIYNEIRKPDKLIVEIISADEDNIHKLLNPAEEDWITYTIKPGDTVKGIPALSIFGGGGYCTAFDDAVRDSILNDTSGLRANIYDLGFDSHYQSVRVFIPDFMIRNKGYIRFRVRVAAKNDARDFSVRDDADEFYIKDIKLMIPCECGDVGLSEVIFDTPYSIFPKDHDSEIPLKVRVRNNVSWDMGSFFINLVIKNAQDSSFDTVNVNNAYNKSVQIPYVRPNQDVLVDFPPLIINGEYFGDTKNVLKILARVIIPGGDRYPDNDSLLATYVLQKGDCFAYDKYHPESDVDKEFDIWGRGLNLYAYSSPDYNVLFATGDEEGSMGSDGGQIAVKFDLAVQDTVFGFYTFWGNRSASLDVVSYSIYKDDNGLPGELIDGSLIYKYRLHDDVKDDYYSEEYVKSLYKDPLILPKGKYWAAVSQLGETGFELGGSGYRMGMVTSVWDRNKGIAGKSLLINKYLTDEYIDSTGKTIISNKPLFAYKNNVFSDTWVAFSPNTGNPAYGHLNHAGTIYNSFDSVHTFTRGTWVPMLRVFMDGKYYKPNDVKEEQALEIIIYPNPASDYIDIYLERWSPSSGWTPSEIQIYNSLGECVLSPLAFGEGPGVRLDISALSPGLYIVNINDGKKILTGSFIVLR